MLSLHLPLADKADKKPARITTLDVSSFYLLPSNPVIFLRVIPENATMTKRLLNTKTSLVQRSKTAYLHCTRFDIIFPWPILEFQNSKAI